MAQKLVRLTFPDGTHYDYVDAGSIVKGPDNRVTFRIHLRHNDIVGIGPVKTVSMNTVLKEVRP